MDAKERMEELVKILDKANDDYYNKDTDRKGISEIIIAKQRNGPVGTIELVWLPELTRFANKEHRKKKNQ